MKDVKEKNMKDVYHLYYAIFFILFPGCSDKPGAGAAFTEPNRTKEVSVMQNKEQEPIDWQALTDTQWKQRLTPLQYRILRKQNTERPFTGKYHLKPDKDGNYACSGCGNIIFTTSDQFNSHCGWPSFSAPADPNAVQQLPDVSHGMTRTEIICSDCGGHLGHVFEDGPAPTGQRYCINSAVIDLKTEEK
jgi:peptide-methionine (R)-S-oxide reductase